MTVKIQFLGAAGTVTGSKYLVTHNQTNILIDAGMFQGSREWRDKNWDKPTFNPAKIDAVCLTHSHIDHIGVLPRFWDQGLNCPVFCTPATEDLARIMLSDSGRLHEQEAEYRSKRGKSRHSPVLPLYTEDSAVAVSRLLKTAAFKKRHEILPGVFATWNQMGHILGAGSIQLEIGGRLITFSGDVGRYSVPILIDPQAVDFGDLLLIESTYGNRLHEPESPKTILAEVINKTYKRGGVVVIPSFAVGRAQLLLYYLRELKAQKLIPDLPVVVDSPMASDATEIYARHPADYDEQAFKILANGQQPFSFSKLGFTQSVSDSIRLNEYAQPMVIISASGMLSGGRILHHLKHRISEAKNTILFVGYQPTGGRGDWIKSGAKSLKLFGDEYPIKAEIAEISGLSAHADRDELLRWCKSCQGTPKKVAVVHGELEVSNEFKTTLSNEFEWECLVPKYQEIITI